MLPLDDVRPLPDVMADRHFLRTSHGICHRALRLLHAARGRPSARSGLQRIVLCTTLSFKFETAYFVDLWLSIGAGGHADDGAAAESVGGSAEGVERAAEQAAQRGHGRKATEGHEGGHGRAVGEGGVTTAVEVREHAERVGEEGVHHVVHLAHRAHVRPERRNKGGLSFKREKLRFSISFPLTLW